MKIFKQIFFIVSFYALCQLTCNAKSTIRFAIIDSFTRESPDSVTVKITKDDGTVVWDHFFDRPVFKNDYGLEHRIILNIPWPVDAPGKYTIEVSAAGHTPKTLTAETTEDKQTISLGTVELDKIVALDEVKVVASKVKMVMKGDTIVYNADAFNLAKGSMLDKLIAMLPGAAINEQGQITVNGEFVSSLLINGKDFFKGNPSVALQNIPYYTVNQVKVYHKEAPDAYLKNRTEADKMKDPLVMDVVMKEKFLGTYIGHADIAGGTERRYSLRAFMGGFGKRHNMAVYGNLNNVGANSNPSKDGSIWSSGMAGIFDNVYRKAGLSYNYMSENGRKRVDFEADGNSDSQNNDYLGVSTAFYPDGYTTSSRTVGGYHATNGRFDSRLSLMLGLPKVYTAASFSVGFRRDTQRTGNSFSQHQGDEYLDTISITNPAFINRVFKRSRTRTTDFNIGGSPSVQFRLPVVGDNMYVTVNAYHYKTKTEDMTATANTTRTNTNILNNFISNPGHSTDLNLNMGVSHSYKFGLSWTLRYSLGHKERRNERALSHFLPDSVLTDLPIVTDRLTMISDLKQSFTATTRKLENTLEPSTSFSAGQVHFNIDMPLIWARERFRDTRAPFINRNTFLFNPTLRITWKFLRFNYYVRNSTPGAQQLLDFIDDSELLTIRKGNPDLKNPRNYDARISFSRMIQKKNLSYSFMAGYTENRRSIANALSFDPQTGVSTIMAFNVNGNRNGYFNASFEKDLGYMKRLNLKASLNSRLERSVAFASTGTPEYAESKVHTTNITPEISLRYSRDLYSVTGSLYLNRFLSRGNLDSFIRTNAWSGGPSVSGWVRLPLDFQIESSVSYSFRTGYADPEMNKSYVYWNASLLKSLGKDGKWNLRFDAVDILGQVSSVSRSVNAQGITETRNSVIGRYFLFHIQYHFNTAKK